MSALVGEPWLRYGDTSLYAVPSIHYRQVFAQLVVEACRRKRFDVIAVELPPSYRDYGIIDAALGLAPVPGMIIHPSGGRIELMRVPVSDDPDCKETKLRAVKRGLMYPLTACDSILMALRCPRLLEKHWPGWNPAIELIDDEYREGERPRTTFPFRDDYEVMSKGLAAFYGRMEASWHRARSPLVDERREKIMGSRLRRFLDEGKEVLFVCGAAHWKSICEYLDSGLRETLATTRPAPAPRLILAPFEPAIAWLWGWLDDIPRVAWELELACQHGTDRSFDKREAVDIVVRETFTQARAAELPVSIRRLLKMKRYAETLASTAGKWIPDLDDHLVPAAEVCVEERFAESLKKAALEFPASLPDGVEMALVRPYEEGKWFILAEGEVFLVEFPKSEGKTGGRRIAIAVPSKLSEDEKQEYDENSSGARDWPDEQKLISMMNLRARELAERQTQPSFSRKFTGSMGTGPDWRRTIRARASGDKALFVRQSRSSGGQQKPRTALVTPVVWIFADSSEIIDTISGSAWSEDGGRPIVSFSYIRETKWLAEGKIKANRQAAFVDIGHGRGFLGRERPSVLDAEREVQVFKSYFRTIPEEKICWVDPWNDPDLRDFVGTDQATAAGIKYADDLVIVVSRSDRPISPAVQNYARARKVKVCRISIENFQPSRLDRFQWLHWVPCRPEPESPPYEWVGRFLPPI